MNAAWLTLVPPEADEFFEETGLESEKGLSFSAGFKDTSLSGIVEKRGCDL